MLQSTDDELVKKLREKDTVLLRTLYRSMKVWQPITAFNLSFRNAEIAKRARLYYTREELEALETFLMEHGTVTLPTRKERITVDNKTIEIVTVQATTADTPGDMSSKVWIRDQTLAGEALLHMWVVDPERYHREGEEAKAILLSSVALMSTPSQLRRFEEIITSKDEEFVGHQHSWPQIALDYNNLSGEELTAWRHIQDAFQMLAYALFEALDKKLIMLDDLDESQKRFLALVVPFLIAVDFTNRKNFGSWEELAVVRTSVLAIETATLAKIQIYAKRNDFAFLAKGFNEMKRDLLGYENMSFDESIENTIISGLEKMAAHLPYESPMHDQESVEYRKADAALVYVLRYGIPKLLVEKNIVIKSEDKVLTQQEIERLILAQVENLTDPVTHGMKRYEFDAYQRQNFHTNYMYQTLRELKKQYIDPREKFIKRQALFSTGTVAAWTLFTPQLAAWAADRFIQTGEDRYYVLATQYFNRTLAQITGENEYQVILGRDESYHVQKTPAYQLPECYISLAAPDRNPLIVASPHTPLHWSMAEMSKACALLIKATKEKENKKDQ